MPYILQSVFILLGPAFYAASIYMALGRLIRFLEGQHHSVIRVGLLTKIFLMGDIFSFFGQGGGAISKAPGHFGTILTNITRWRAPRWRQRQRKPGSRQHNHYRWSRDSGHILRGIHGCHSNLPHAHATSPDQQVPEHWCSMAGIHGRTLLYQCAHHGAIRFSDDRICSRSHRLIDF